MESSPTMDSDYKAKTTYQQDAVAQNYDHDRFTSWYGRLAHNNELRCLEWAVDAWFKPGGSIVDLPCGTGRLLIAYGDRFNVTGVDISNAMLDVARSRFAGNPRFRFQIGDAEKLPFPDNSFDYLVSFRLMCHLPREIRIRVLCEMARVTRKALVVNYHFDVRSPLMLFNRLFRKSAAYLPYPLKERDLRAELAGCPVALVATRKLSWYERSSALIVFNKAPQG